MRDTFSIRVDVEARISWYYCWFNPWASYGRSTAPRGSQIPQYDSRWETKEALTRKEKHQLVEFKVKHSLHLTSSTHNLSESANAHSYSIRDS